MNGLRLGTRQRHKRARVHSHSVVIGECTTRTKKKGGGLMQAMAEEAGHLQQEETKDTKKSHVDEQRKQGLKKKSKHKGVHIEAAQEG